MDFFVFLATGFAACSKPPREITEVGKAQLEVQLPQPPQLHKLCCALVFYFETLRKLRCGIKPLKFVVL